MKRVYKIKYLFAAVLFITGSIILMSMSDSLMQDWPVPAKYMTMKNTKAGVKDTEGIGKSLYIQHCQSCHGAKAAGDGKKAAALKSEMKNWVSKEVQSQKDGELYYKSFIGKGEMPNFEKKIISEGDRWFLINYIRTYKKP